MSKNVGLILAVILFSSCSLKYGETVNVEEKIPEFVFQDSTITRFEDKKETVQISAGVLEQYKDSSETFAKDVNFTAFKDDGDIRTEGYCGYLYTDTENDVYELYDGIELYDLEDSTSFYADVLKWNAKNEQLTTGRGNMVRVETEDTVMLGSGFSASGISKNFVFTGTVSGDIETK